MFLGLGVIVWMLGLAFVIPARRLARWYSTLSLLFTLAGLVLFTLLAWWANIFPMRFGDGGLIVYSVSFPHAYSARGALGPPFRQSGFWQASRPPRLPGWSADGRPNRASRNEAGSGWVASDHCAQTC